MVPPRVKKSLAWPKELACSRMGRLLLFSGNFGWSSKGRLHLLEDQGGHFLWTESEGGCVSFQPLMGGCEGPRGPPGSCPRASHLRDNCQGGPGGLCLWCRDSQSGQGAWKPLAHSIHLETGKNRVATYRAQCREVSSWGQGLRRSWAPLKMEGNLGANVCDFLGSGVLRCFLPVCKVPAPDVVRRLT